MKRAKLKVGALVQVPTTCWNEMRRGWNGWLFSAGIITKVGKTKLGYDAAVVEYPTKTYGQQLKNIRGEIIGFGERKTISKTFYADAIFEYGRLEIEQEFVNKHKRNEVCDNCYSVDSEFLIDRGFIKDNK